MKFILENLKKKFVIFKKKKYHYKNIKCEICNSNSSSSLQNLGKVGNSPGEYGYLPVAICDYCGHKFLSPRLSNEYYRKFYLDEYGKIPFKKKKPPKKYIQLQKERGEKIFQYFNKEIKFSKKYKILDHGAATGLALLPWKKKGWDTFGIEPHIESVKVAKSYGLNVKQGYGEKTGYKNNFFNLIISLGSFEHAYDINATFSEFNRILKKNGNLILRWRSDKFTGSPLEYYNFITYRYFTRISLKNLLSKYGFKIIKYINKKIEGYDTYEYIYAVKLKKNSNKIRKFNIKRIFDYHKNYYSKYYKFSKKLEAKNFRNFNQKLNYVVINKIGIMNIGKKKSINRVFKDAKYYLRAIKNFKLSINNFNEKK